MRKIVTLFFSFFMLMACESDCITCHPKLKQLESPKSPYYKQHYFLKDCTKCHKNHPTKGMDECGADCFDCHSREKLIHTNILDHQKLKTCTKCHKDEGVLEELRVGEKNWLLK